MDGAASDDEEISALGASPARPRAGGSAARARSSAARILLLCLPGAVLGVPARARVGRRAAGGWEK